MSSSAKRAHTRANARVCAPQISIERQLGRFRPELQASVRSLARRHERLAQLSLSFPALLAALACPRRRINSAAIIANAITGAPLAVLAAEAGIPMWLRRMRPEMLPAPIPELPDSFFLRRRIVNHFPMSPSLATKWFTNVSFAARWSGEPFALWCAQVFAKARRRRRRVRNMGLLCLWWWYSGQSGSALGRKLIARPWSQDMEFQAALNAAFAWREALDLHLHLGLHALAELWHKPACVDGYDFVPLRAAAEIEDEAKAMDNCLRTYAELVAQDASRLWSVRQGGARVATMEVGFVGDSPVASIQQLCRPRNAEPSRELWIAAHRWMHAQPLHVRGEPAPDWNAIRPDRHVWQELWKPYWLAKRHVPDWLPLVPSRDTLFAL